MKIYRIWFGCSLGLLLSMLFNWDYGFLAVLLPMFVLTKSDVMNLKLFVLVIGSAIFVTLTATLIWEWTKHSPIIMFLSVAPLMFLYCIAMLRQETFVLGYIGILVGSVVFNLASYNFIDITNFNINLWIICIANVLVCALSYYFFPEEKHNIQIDSKKNNTVSCVSIKEICIVWFLTMIAFVIFQSADLYDSASANASIFVMLAPMSMFGVIMSAKVRVVGTAIGCSMGLLVHLVLGVWLNSAILYWLLISLCIGFICSMLVKDKAMEAIGYSSMSALCVPLTTALVPGRSDAVFNTVYRFSSIFLVVLVSSFVFLAVHAALEITSRSQRVAK